MKDMSADELIKKYGVWGEHPDFPVQDWRYQVINNETRIGYLEWVAAELEFAAIERESRS